MKMGHGGRSRFRLWAGILALGMLLSTLIPASALAFDLEKKVKEYTLKNGIRVLMVPQAKSPTVALYIAFAAGAVLEQEGESGVAHLLEHVMFKGTETIGTSNYKAEAPLMAKIDAAAADLDGELRRGAKADQHKITQLRNRLKALQDEQNQYIIKDELWDTYTKNGGEGLNASTSMDITTYHLSLPNNRLELWAAMEADRIQNPIFREFYQERDVVMEERRQRVEADPDGKLMEKFLALAFTAHPYRRPIIGWDSNVAFLSRAQAEAFYRKHYLPQRMVITLVGDFDPAATLILLEKYFGAIPGNRKPEPFYPSDEPPPSGERRVAVTFDARPQLIIGFHKPTWPHLDDYVTDVISDILSSGRTSRLYRRLVEKDRIAQAVYTYNGFPASRYDNLFLVFAVPQGEHTIEELEKAVYEELELLKTAPVTDWELQKTINNMEAGFLRALDSNAGLAGMLSYYETQGIGWRYLLEYGKILRSIKAADVQAVAGKYFYPDNRIVGFIEPPIPRNK